MPPPGGGAPSGRGGKPSRGGGGGGGQRGRGGRGGRGGGAGGRRDDREPRAKLSTTKREEAEIKQLEARIAAEAPPPGSSESSASDFAQLPLSRYTQTGLQRGKFRSMTQIQRIAIPHALAG
jgi:hypothetical protein